MRAKASPNFRTVALDVDSTLSGIEGIDWLAQLRGSATAARVSSETERVMNGEVALEDIYAARLGIVAPSREDIDSLSAAYLSRIAPGAERAIASWQSAGIQVVLVSGGIRNAILPLARRLGVREDDVHAVDIYFDDNGSYSDYDRASPLATAMGKRAVLSRIHAVRPLLAAGDGSTDIAMREVADTFVAFTGFAARENVVREARIVASSFDELTGIILGGKK